MLKRIPEPAENQTFSSLNADEQSQMIGGYTALITHKVTLVGGERDELLDVRAD